MSATNWFTLAAVFAMLSLACLAYIAGSAIGQRLR